MQSDEFHDTSAGGDPAVDDAALAMLLAAAHQRCRAAFNDGLRAAGVEARQFGVLLTLSRHGPTSQRHLLELLHVDKSAMVRIIDELERKGLAVRARDTHDRRAYAVELTEDGRERLAVTSRIASEVGAELFSWLRPHERRQLVDLLDRLAERPRAEASTRTPMHNVGDNPQGDRRRAARRSSPTEPASGATSASRR